MLFDLEPYLPIEAFFTIWMLCTLALVGWLEIRDNRKD